MHRRVGAITMPSDAPEELKLAVARHDSQIDGMVVQISGLNSKIDLIVADLHKIGNALALQGSKPSFSFERTLDVVVKVGGLVALVVAGIVYITGASLNTQIEAFKSADSRIGERIESQSRRMELVEKFLFSKGMQLSSEPNP